MKRVIDIVLSLAALAVFAAPMLVVIAIIRLSDGGPAFYRQQRVGLGGSHFWMLKFRSMVLNADKVGGYMTADNDPRITRIGAFLRRTSIDELPQLINVLVGDMSLVGPRPDVPAQEVHYTPAEWRLRHSVRPGVTGLAQAIARSSATLEERTALDLKYVRSVSVGNDFYIMYLTARHLFVRAGN